MIPITAINIFLWIMVTCIVSYGMWLVSRHTPKSKHRNHLMVMLGFWLIVSFGIYIVFARVSSVDLPFNQGVLNMPMIILGVPSFLVTIGFLLNTLHPRLSTLKGYCIFLSPMLLVYGSYFLIHYLLGYNPLEVYPSLSFVAQNITEPRIIMRLLAMATFWSYMIVVMYNLWTIAPAYQKFTRNNLSESVSNLSWLKKLVFYFSILCCTYTAMVMTNNLYVNTIYIISLIMLFVFFIEDIIFSHVYDELDNLGLEWSMKGGWVIVQQEKPVVESLDVKYYFEALARWMVDERPYTKINFTTQDVVSKFPDLSQSDIAKILKSKGESFHSFVRKHRVDLACCEIERQKENVLLKKLAYDVGFSHYSSFSRAFFQTKSLSPSDYLDIQIKKS